MTLTDYIATLDDATDYEDALGAAVEAGYRVNKYADPIEGPREGLTAEEAADVAAEDPSLIWLAEAK